MRTLALVVLAILLVAGAGCTMTKTADNFNGLTTFDGKTPTHINTTNYAIHLLFTRPLVGNATLQQTVADFTAAAKAAGASRVRIVQSRPMVLWFIFPPITFIVQPVITNVAGDATS